jgi:signal transduction histidine kinase
MVWRFLLILWLASITAYAQNLSFVNYGFNQGLHHSQVIDITQDRYGNLWIVPLTGSLLYRFNGRDFQRVDVLVEGVHQSVRLFSIASDDNENIWLLTSIGLVRFDGKRFYHLPFDKPALITSLSNLFVDSNSVVWVIDDNGNIFTCVNNAVSAYQHHEGMKGRPIGFSEYEKEPFVFSIRGEIMSLKTKKPVALSFLKGDDLVRYAVKDEASYIVVTDNEIIRYETSNKILKRFKHDLNQLTQILSYGNDLIILSNGSIRVLNEEGNKIIENQPGFDNHFVQKIFKDQLGSIWLGTDSQGIFNLANQQALNIPIPNNDIPVAIYPLGDDKILAGTYKSGLVEIDHKQVKDLGLKEVQGKIVMSATKGPNNTILVGTQQNGAFALSPGNKTVPTGRQVRKLEMGKVNPPFVLPITTLNDEVWLGSSYGLHQFSNSLVNKKNYSYKQLGALAHFNVIFPIDSALLIGSAGEGVLLFDPKKDTLTKLPGYQTEASIYLMKRDAQGQIWIGGEFPRIIILNNKLKRIASIDLARYCSNILTFEFFGNDRLLVGSNDGVFTITLGDGYRISSVRRLGLADGYKGGEVCMASMTRVNDKIWFGTSDGVYCYFIGSDKEMNPTPFTYVNDVRLFNKETDWREYSKNVKGMYGLPQGLELDHGNNNLTFSFYANDFHDNEDLQFHYWLEGSNTSWSEFSTDENITYSSLPAGNYTFHVQSKDGVNLGNIANFHFVILPAFWETKIFYVLVAALTTIIIFILVRIITRARIKRFQLKEQIRATESAKLRRQMAMDFHDEMGNKLASVLAYSSSLKLVSANKENHELFDYFEKNAAAIYYGTKDFIWSIDVESNNLIEVITYLRDFGANFFEKHGIDFLVENDILNESFNRSLPDGHNRQLVLLFKEAMTNVLKHSKATKVYFDVVAKGNVYKIILADDGVGLGSKNGKGKGLKSMADRADKISGLLNIEQVVPHGTRVTLQFKV